MINKKYKVVYEIFKQDIEQGIYDKSIVAFTMQMGRISAYLELSDFTEVERNNEENRLRELYVCWAKNITSRRKKINDSIQIAQYH